MTKIDKLKKRILSHPHDFTFEELSSLLTALGYHMSDKGKTSGSRVEFISDNFGPIQLHKPHNGNELKMYQIKQICELLISEGLLNK